MNKTHKHKAAKTPLEAADELATERNMVSDTTRTTKGEDFAKGSFFYLIPYFRAYYLESLEFDNFQWSFDTSSCCGLVIAADHPEHGRRSFLITEMNQGGPLTNELIPQAQNYIRGYMEMLVQEAAIRVIPQVDLPPEAAEVASLLIRALFEYDSAGDVLAKYVRDVRSRNTPPPVH